LCPSMARAATLTPASASQVVQSVLRGAGFSCTDDPEDASVVLLNTCAIREGAEQRIWGRLGRFKALKAERRAAARRETGCAVNLVHTRAWKYWVQVRQAF